MPALLGSPAVIVGISPRFDPGEAAGPLPTLVSTFPATGATGVSTSASIVLTYSVPVVATAGLYTLSSGGSSIEEKAANSGSVTVSGAQVTIVFSTSKSAETAYSCTAPAGVLTDAAGNPVPALSITFTTAAAPAGEFDEGTLATNSSIAWRGVTFTFNNPVKWLSSATGDPVVITRSDLLTAGTTMTAMLPAWDGSKNGAEINPVYPNRNDPIGFDSRISADLGGTTGIDYSSALNVDPGNAGALAIAQGSSFSVVKALGGASGFRAITTFVTITFMSDVPPAAGTWFRPGSSNADKEWPGTMETVISRRASISRDLTIPSSMMTVSEALAEIVDNDLQGRQFARYPGEQGQRLQLIGEASEYSAYYADERALEVMALHDDAASDAQWNQLAAIEVQYGIDLASAYDAGRYFSAGAGQANGYLEYLYLAGFALGDPSYIVRARDTQTNSTSQIDWVRSYNIGWETAWPNTQQGVNWQYQYTLFEEDLGVPEWWQGGIGDTDREPGAPYRKLNINPGIGEMLAICLLDNGPSGETGAEALAGGSDFTEANELAAPIMYMDRAYPWFPWDAEGGTDDPLSAAMIAAYTFRDEFLPAKWTGRPDTPTPPRTDLFTAGGADGEIDWDLSWPNSQRGWTTLSITQQDIAYSQDPEGIQYVVSADVGGTGTLTGLRHGTVHRCRYRRHNSAGASAWSANAPLLADNPANSENPDYLKIRGEVTTGGAASGTAVNVVAPAIHRRLYPWWDGPYYFEPVSGTALETETVFYAGVGYWTGGTSFTPIYMWEINDGGGWEATGTDQYFYTRTAGDAGKQLRLKVGIAGVTATSAAITIPTASTFPSGTLVDTDCDGALPFQWPDFWANIQASDAANANIDVQHLYAAQLPDADTRGSLWVKKVGSNPTLQCVVASGVTAGTYTVEVDFGVGYFSASSVDFINGNTTFEIRNGAGTVLFTSTILPTEAPTVQSDSGTFAISGGDNVVMRLRTNASPGGLGGAKGGPILTKLKIYQP